jgi:hypothetical protein
MSVTHKRSTLASAHANSDSTVDWDQLLHNISAEFDPFHPSFCREALERDLSTLLLFHQWREAPPIRELVRNCYCSLLIQVFRVSPSDLCEDLVVRLIRQAITSYPQCLPAFLENGLVNLLYTYLEYSPNIPWHKRDLRIYGVLGIIIEIASSPLSIRLVIDPVSDHLSFFDQFLNILDSIISESSDNPHIPDFPEKTEERIYILLHTVAQWPELPLTYAEAAFDRFAFAFEQQRLGDFSEIVRGLRLLWNRVELRDFILSDAISRPILGIVADAQIEHGICDYLSLALEIVRVRTDLLPMCNLNSLLFIAEKFADEGNSATDTALLLIVERIGMGEDPDFDLMNLRLFSAAQFGEPHPTFHRQQAAASVVFALVLAIGVGQFENNWEMISAAFEGAQAGDERLVRLAFEAGARITHEIAVTIEIEPELFGSIMEFLVTMEGSGNAEFANLAIAARTAIQCTNSEG